MNHFRTVFLSLIFILGIYANENTEDFIILQEGVFNNGFQAKQSTGYVSTTSEYQGNVVIYIMLSQNGYLNLQRDVVSDLSKYKYLQFDVSWDQLGINLGLEIGIGQNDETIKKVAIPQSMKVNKKNRVVVDLQSLQNELQTAQIIRIYKTDKSDTNVYFNNVKLTIEKGESGFITSENTIEDGSWMKSLLTFLFFILFTL